MVRQTLDEWRASWGRPARIDPALTTVVVANGGDPVGVATCSVHDGDGPAYLAQLAVAREARGRGLGRALLVETFRLAQEAVVAAVALDVNAANSGATALYESVGMRQEWHADRWVKRLG
jgi:ribosomal protein S18 acetylase RimI-like enzyme